MSATPAVPARIGALASLLFVSLLTVKGADAQAPSLPASCAGVEGETRIALDNGGVANWIFQNPRRPYPVLHVRTGVGLVGAATEACFNATFATSASATAVVVRFVNETPDRLFEVRVPFKLPQLDFASPASTNICDWTAKIPAPSGGLILKGQTQSLGYQCDEIARKLAANPRQSDPNLAMVAVCQSFWGDPTQRNGVPAGDVAARNYAATIKVMGSQPGYCDLINSLIDPKGDAQAFLDRFASLCNKVVNGYDCTYSLPVSQGAPSVFEPEVLRYLSSLNSPGLLPLNVYFVGDSNLPSHNVIYLQVKPEFDEPASSTVWQFSGSVGASTNAELNQSDKEAFNAASGAQEEAFSAFVRTDLPYRGAREDDFNGGANFKLIQKLGNRADGSATLDFKAGNLGEADQERKVTVSDYALRLYGDNGTQVRFGKYDLASSREKIALVEKGEAVEILWRFASLGAVFKRENVDGPAAKKSEGYRSLVLQLKDITIAGLPSWRSFNLLAARGRNEGQPTFANLIPAMMQGEAEKITDEERYLVAYTYDTVGGDASFAIPNGLGKDDWIVSGSLAGYWSQRKIDEVSKKLGGVIPDRIDPAKTIMEGEGTVGLLTVIVSKPGVKGRIDPSPYSFRLQLGYGTGDEAKTPNRNEGYVGETTGFAPDKIFLARLASAVRTDPKVLDLLVPVGSGLSNKTYAGGTVTDTKCRSWLPLVAMARMIGIREEISACNSQLRLHHYELNEPVFAGRGTEAGNELNIDFSVTVPKGITTSLGFGHFHPGNALQGVVKDDPWVLSASVSVTM